ncbi:thioredoxin family protein [Curvibacter sp. HBC28]|uniref:Thioredoxin family protein n=1 Tax=Curvibacter microcysteis TaxID=3026419 RepID=A0ABT5MC70_9BURK|nr:thioredoxin family protein [Curvibacter sp. HBC28]MDD0813589.1 thioredoxin family protein [Curvibacter sp. HBC28]
MTAELRYSPQAPSRADVDTWPGATLLQFGTDWCAHCQAAQGPVIEALAARPGLRHQLVEDGSGRPLGRSFAVKLWPTLIALVDGQETGRLVRPTDTATVAQWLTQALPPA